MILFVGRHCSVLDDDKAPQKINVRSFDYPADSQGVIDYVRDVLVDPSFFNQDRADAHALRALVEHYLSATPPCADGYPAHLQVAALEAATKMLDFVKEHPLGVTVA